ncbi:MAG: ATP-binding protein [Candidatus Aenigmarchaeota archaeon]|nr:ATP-binding protein [Candidatus Aenigmarchaeota archaeon]
MKFYDREKELSLLRNLDKAKNLRFVVVKGMRRIGKTSLLLKHLKDRDFLYAFVPKGKTPELFLEDICAELKLPVFSKMNGFLRYIFDRYKFIFFDEFQNFYFIDSSIYSEMQKLIDEYSNKEIAIFATGSSYSLMKKIFSDYSKALYGRRDIEITLDELPLLTSFEMMNDIGIRKFEEQIKIWAVFGGMPKSYALMEKLSIKSFSDFEEIFFKEQIRTLMDEGAAILISEFGGDYKIFYSLLEAISIGRTTLSEISSVFGSDATTTNRYLTLLRNDYNLIIKQSPITESAKSKRGRYMIKNNFLRFWFSFIKRHESLIEQGRIKELTNIISENLNSFIGRAFEEVCKYLVAERIVQLPFICQSIGRQWGNFKGETGRNEYEIDIAGVNQKTKDILFGECKWKDNVNPEEILSRLKEKAKYVKWNNNNRKEHYIIFAKSFSKTTKDAMLFDLRRIEQNIEKNRTL